MKVLLINNYRNNRLGGVENYLQELINYAQNDVVFKWFGNSSETTKWNQKFYNRQITNEIIAEIDAFQPDIIHCFSIGAAVTPHFLSYAKAKSIPIIYSFRDYYYICPKGFMLTTNGAIIKEHNSFLECILHHHPKKNILFDSLLFAKQAYHKRIIKKNIDFFLTPSEKLSQFIEKEFQVPGKTLTNPVLIQNSNLPKSSEHLLFVGRLEKEKGIETLLKAFKRILQKHPNERLIIVGSGAYKKQLEDFTEQHKIKNVSFVGTKKGNDLGQLYASSKFTIIPSEILESYGNVILESFAFKKTVVISDLLGIASEVENTKSGLIFPFGNIEKLIEAIEKLLTDSTLREELEQNAFLYAEDKSFENHFKELLEVYHQFINLNIRSSFYSL